MVLRLVLGTVYAAMAVGQVVSFGRMPGILSAYGLVVWTLLAAQAYGRGLTVANCGC